MTTTINNNNGKTKKQKVEELLKKINPNVEIENEASELLLSLLNRVVDDAATKINEVTRDTIEFAKLKEVFNDEYGITIPGFASEDFKGKRIANKRKQALNELVRNQVSKKKFFCFIYLLILKCISPIKNE